MLKISLIFLFLIERALFQFNQCNIPKCLSCFEFKTLEQKGCICTECPKTLFSHICTIEECRKCESGRNSFINDCFCSKCDYEAIKKEDEKENKKKMTEIIVGTVCSAVVIIFFLLLIIYLKVYKCKKRERNIVVFHINNENIDIRDINDNNINIYNHNNNINSNDRIIKNKISLDDIFNKVEYLGPKKCKKEYEKYNIECSICLEKFKDEIDMISITPCFHLFHNKCLSGYFKKNKKAKCPNCNFKI